MKNRNKFQKFNLKLRHMNGLKIRRNYEKIGKPRYLYYSEFYILN